MCTVPAHGTLALHHAHSPVKIENTKSSLFILYHHIYQNINFLLTLWYLCINCWQVHLFQSRIYFIYCESSCVCHLFIRARDCGWLARFLASSMSNNWHVFYALSKNEWKKNDCLLVSAWARPRPTARRGCAEYFLPEEDRGGPGIQWYVFSAVDNASSTLASWGVGGDACGEVSSVPNLDFLRPAGAETAPANLLLPLDNLPRFVVGEVGNVNGIASENCLL